MNTTAHPIAEGETKLVRLASSPLKRVLCVIHFAPVMRIAESSGSGVAAFQEMIRGEYPALKTEFAHEIQVEADDKGVISDPRVNKHLLWRFIDKNNRWRVSLGQRSLALEAADAYVGRADLLDRFVRLIGALNVAYAPVIFERLGIRYFNLFDGEKLRHLDKYVHPHVMGFGREVAGFDLIGSLVQLHLDKDNLQMLIKSGFLQPGMQTDMQVTPLEQPAWLLDIDASRALDGSIDDDAIRTISTEITNAICGFFAWSVTKQFVEDYRHG